MQQLLKGNLKTNNDYEEVSQAQTHQHDVNKIKVNLHILNFFR